MVVPPELGGGDEMISIAAIGAAHRRGLDRGVVGKVLLAENAAIGLARRDDRVGDRPLVEGVRTVLRDRLQRRGQLALHQPLADLPGLAVVEEDRRDIGLPGEGLGAAVEDVDIALRQHVAVARRA